MKRTSFTLILIISFLFSFSQKTWVGFTTDSPQQPGISIVEQNTEKVIFDISVPGMYVSDIENQGTVYKRLELTEFQTTSVVGYPELPTINQIIGIPGDKLARFRIIEVNRIILSNYNLYPFQVPEKDIKGGKSDEFIINKDFYSQNIPFPSGNVALDEPGIWRDVKTTGLHIVPFTYYPQNKEIEVITHLKIEVEFYGHDSEHYLARDKSITPEYYRMYDAAISNFSSLSYTMTYRDNPGIKYLIITNEGALQTIQPLIDFKNQQGFRVEVKTLETGFEEPEDFKTYIQQLYTSDGLEYVLMVGDAYPNGGQGGGPNIVPMFWWAPSPDEDSTFSDTWYVCLDGSDDHYADLAIGRFVYDDLNELDIQIQKTLSHYTNPDASTNWAENTILVAHQEDYPEKYTQCKEDIRIYNYSLQTPIFTPCYGGAGATNNDIVNYVNNTSCGIFNYRGHGSATEFWEWCGQGSFTNTYIQQMTNTRRLFVLFDVCCDNMDIVEYDGDCLSESFMKSPVASVAVNSAIIPSYTVPNHDYDKEMYKAIFQEGIYNIGYVTNFANLTVLNIHGNLGRSNVRTFLWLGDASLEPWTLQPAELTVTHDPQLFLGLTEFSVSVNGTMGPVENAMVCVSNEDGSIYGVAYTDAAGLATVLFSEPAQVPGFAKVTVTSHNYLPYQAEIPVIPLEGAYVVKDSFTINDEAGNANGLMDYGESIALTMTVKNVGLDSATGVTVELGTSDEYITLTTNSAYFGDIPAEGTVTVVNAFAFDVASTIPDNHNVLFEVSATDGTNIWVSNFSIQGHAPVLELGDFTIFDPTGNNNGKIDPGETVDISIMVDNTGSSAANDVQGVLQSSDPYVTINVGSGQYGEIAGEGSAAQTFTVSADINTPVGHTALFDFGISATGGINGTGTFNTVIGQIPVAIIDLDANHSSGPALQEAIQTIDVACDYLTTLPSDLNLYSSVFVCLGIYTNNHVLTSTEGQALADFVQSGGMIYMEGGDTWAYDGQTAVHTLFSISGTADGTSDLGTITGQTGTFTENMSFTYSGENNYIDHLEPLGNAFPIFANQSPEYINAVANDAGSYKTIGASFEFGGLDDGATRFTKEDLMKEYLDFFGILPPEILANFTASETDICQFGTVQFNDFSLGQIISWQWSFPGGDPSASAEQNPQVTYATPGVYDVTLTVSNGTASHSITRLGYITVNELPSAAITGTASICFGDSALITVELTGLAPWTINLSNGDILTAYEWPYNFWVKPEITTDYSIVSVTDANGCSSEGTGMATVTVNALPSAILTGTTTICSGDSTQLSVELTGQAPWTILTSDGNVYTTSDMPYIFWIQPKMTTDFSITGVTDGNGCNGEGTGTATISVNELPTALLQGDASLCPGDSAQLIIELTGQTPWTVELTDGAGTSFIYENIPASPFEPWFIPSESITLSVDQVTDANLCSNNGTGSFIFTIKPLPGIPVTPEGADSVDVYKVTTTEFTTTGSEYALTYSWQLLPENAGTIDGTGLTGTIIWNTQFTGGASVLVKGINECGESEFSTAKTITVHNSVGYDDLSTKLAINIFPNPNKGSFMLEVNAMEKEIINIRLINSQGSTIFVLNDIPVQGIWSRNIEINNIEGGIYYLLIEGTGGVIAQKVEVCR